MQDFEGTVYTFGFGSDHNGDLLTAISNAANGVYYFIDSTEKVSSTITASYNISHSLSSYQQSVNLITQLLVNCFLAILSYNLSVLILNLCLCMH